LAPVKSAPQPADYPHIPTVTPPGENAAFRNDTIPFPRTNSSGNGSAEGSKSDRAKRLSTLATLHAVGVLSEDDFTILVARIDPPASGAFKNEIFERQANGNSSVETSVPAGAEDTLNVFVPLFPNQSKISQRRFGAAAANRRRILRFLIFLLLIAGFLYFDDAFASLLPSELYCVIGAGKTVIEPMTRTVDGDCNASSLECGQRWTQHCVHGSLLTGIQAFFHELNMHLTTS
jgi:hypothetical protein